MQKLILIRSSLFLATLFLALTYDHHEQSMQQPIKEDLDLRATAGKLVW